jgi:hypothetical protein
VSIHRSSLEDKLLIYYSRREGGHGMMSGMKWVSDALDMGEAEQMAKLVGYFAVVD